MPFNKIHQLYDGGFKVEAVKLRNYLRNTDFYGIFTNIYAYMSNNNNESSNNTIESYISKLQIQV